MSMASSFVRSFSARIVLLVWVVATAHVAIAGTLTIMPLGDSITQSGVGVVGGYRGPLYNLLTNAGYSVQAVGSQTTSSGTLPANQIHHEGHSGYMITAGTTSSFVRDGLTNHINTWLAPGTDPDIILLMIGTNDIYDDYQCATAPDRLSSLISMISDPATGLKPKAKLIVAQITPINDDTKDARVQAYNIGVASVVASHKASGESVSLVDMHSALDRNTDFTSDIYGVHPDQSGYNKMANVWFQGIQTVIPEPSAFVALATGALAFGIYWWQNRK